MPEWNSLIALSVIATVEDEFGVALSGSDIVGVRTVRDIFGVATKRKSGTAIRAIPSSVRLWKK